MHHEFRHLHALHSTIIIFLCGDSPASKVLTKLRIFPSGCVGFRDFALVWDRVPAAGPVRDFFQPVVCDDFARPREDLGTIAVDGYPPTVHRC